MRTRGIGEGPLSYTWSFPVCPHRVTVGLNIVEALQVELASGAETRCGLLFGDITAGLTRINHWESLPALDAASIEPALAAASLQAVGYYVIRDGSAFVLSPSEVALAQDYFNTQGSVVLLVERRGKGPAEASFFFWRRDVFVHNLPLPFPFHAGILAGETPGLADVPAAAPARQRTRGKAPARFARLALYGISAMAAGGLLAAFFRDHRGFASFTPTIRSGPAPDTAVWIPTQPRQDLELTWDPRSEAVASATAGVLKIEDGGIGRQISLDVGELLLGAVLYAPVSDRIRVELTTLQRDGRMAPVPLSPRTASPDTSASVPAHSDPAPVTKGDPLAGLTAKAEGAEKKIEIPAPIEERRPPLKRFTWNGADRISKSSPEIPDAPHAAPPAISPSALTASLPPAAFGVPSAPPPPPPKATPAPAKPAPRAGRVIWTGTLQRRGIVELDGRSVSVGALNGMLPGVPVNLTITPAEFGPDGLVVYTTEASRHNRVEPPSASNGWNQVTFVWDPERVRQLSVLEAPNANNGYSRITLRNDARRCSMILIDWTLR